MTKLFALALLLLVNVCVAQNQTVPFNSTKIRYEGRIQHRIDASEFSWPGTSATINFEGTSVSAVLKDLDTANYYNVIIDDIVVSTLKPSQHKQSYLLASKLKNGKHTVQLFKRTEWDKGKTLFYGFEIPQSAKLLAPPAEKKRKIEFFGNSITCGYGIEDFSGRDRGIGYYQNNYLTYAALTARHFNAQYHCTAKSGIGIMVSWFPLIMPEMYNRTDATDPNSVWDFSQYTPDVVVINLFQNDSWIVNQPNYKEYKNRFGNKKPTSDDIINAYKAFVQTLRKTYPSASIICALGNMDATRDGSEWPKYIAQAVKQINDPKIYSTSFDYKNTGGHPKVTEQKIMADSLIKFIDTHIKW